MLFFGEQTLVRRACNQHSSPMKHGCVGLAVAVFLALGPGAATQAEPSGPVIAQIAKQFDERPLIMIGELHRWEQCTPSCER
jgi:hypothetical protein